MIKKDVMYFALAKIMKPPLRSVTSTPPNEDSPGFFEHIFKLLNKNTSENMIVGGDFNLAINTKLDRLQSTYNNCKSAKYIQAFMAENGFHDVWRDRNPDCKRYSWFRKENKTAARIDFFLTNTGMSGNISNIEYEYGCRTDHAMVSLTYDGEKVKRGKGVWKMNAQLLKCDKYCQMIQKCIKNTIELCTSRNCSKTEIWETIKSKCITNTQKWSKNLAKTNKELISNLRILYSELVHEKLKNSDIYVNDAAITEVQNKIVELEVQKIKSSAFRAQCTWHKHGEKMSKYYFSLEKRKYVDKTMNAIELADGTICKSQKRILMEQQKFYEDLYTADPTIDFNLKNTTDIYISDEQRVELDKDITLIEMRKAIFEMKKGKVPGIDGIPIEFYCTFIEEIQHPLFAMYQEVQSTGTLGRSTRKGLISLLPKRNKDPRKLRNLRPLTLLCNDYKVLAKMMANRLKLVLPSIISEEQTGFMSGRDIHSNIRRTMDIISHVNQTKKLAVIISIDFEKCFDRIEHKSIVGSLRFFKFGETLIEWIKVFFRDMWLCTQNAGELSPLFKKSRGTNQGCPISPFLYNLCGEVMTQLIKNNANIQGVDFMGVRNIITQFADDTGLFLTYTEESITAAIQTLELVERNTGLKVSYEKTTIYRIGSLKNTNAKIYTCKPIKWSDDDIDMLGVIIKNTDRQSNEGFDTCIEKMANVSELWFHRNATLTAKILLINSLMSSLFIYKMCVLPLMSDKQLNRIRDVIVKFLWKGKRPKIPLKILQLPKKQGGMGLCNFNERHKSMYVKWIPYIRDKPSFEYVHKWLCPKLKSIVFECNTSIQDIKVIFKDSFWRDVLMAWSEINYKWPQDIGEIKEQIIWYNTEIKCGKKTLTPRSELVDKGILRVRDFLDENNKWLTEYEFCEKFEVKYSSNWLWYRNLMDAIPGIWKTMVLNVRIANKPNRFTHEELISSKKPSSLVYDFKMSENKDNTLTYATKWYKVLDQDQNEGSDYDSYLRLHKNARKLTDNIKMRDFQYRLLLGKIYTNDVLKKWKIVDSEMCDYCLKERQTITHLLFECELIRKVWEYFTKIFGRSDRDFEWTLVNIMSNLVHPKPKHKINLIVLIVKQFIFQCKCMGVKPNHTKAAEKVLNFYEIEKYNAKLENKVCKIDKDWEVVVHGVTKLQLERM